MGTSHQRLEKATGWARLPDLLASVAEVAACEEIGNGCNVAEGAKVKSRGVTPPQTIFYGDAGLVAYDPSSMVVSEQPVLQKTTKVRSALLRPSNDCVTGRRRTSARQSGCLCGLCFLFLSSQRQAASAVAQLPTHRRLLTNHI